MLESIHCTTKCRPILYHLSSPLARQSGAHFPLTRQRSMGDGDRFKETGSTVALTSRPGPRLDTAVSALAPFEPRLSTLGRDGRGGGWRAAGAR